LLLLLLLLLLMGVQKDDGPVMKVPKMVHAIGDKRARDEAEEQEVVAGFLLYAEAVKRAQAAGLLVQGAVDAVIRAYVHWRGGMQEIRVFAIPDGSFQPAQICEKFFVQHFRFTHAEMDRVVLALLNVGFPQTIRSASRDKCSLYDAVCMMCFKYAWPTRLGTMVKTFCSSTSRMSRLVSCLRRLIFKHFHRKLRNPPPLSLVQLETYCDAVAAKSGLDICFGFIDGTVRPICKPSVLQGSCYNGKDRVHAIKYQAVSVPDGMFLQLCGPWPGARHDQFLLKESELVPYLMSLPRRGDGAMHVIYADQGYSDDVGIQTPYFDGAVNARHEAFNQAMASSRISVEWAFGGIIEKWSSQAFTRTQQLLSNRKIGQVYIVASFLCNLLNTLQRNNTSHYFGVHPPVLESYLQSMFEH
jgi:hypothetical protein